MTQDEELCGALPFGNLTKFLEYLPLLTLVQQAGSAQTLDAKCTAVVGVLKFVADKTSTRLDNDFLAVLEPCLKTKEGMSLLLWFAERASAIVEGDRIAQMQRGV
jgi:hypothetical protein